MQDEDRASVAAALIRAAEEGDPGRVEEQLAELHFSDVANLLELMDTPERGSVVRALGSNLDPRVFPELRPEVRNQMIDLLGPARLAGRLVGLETDDLIEIAEDLDTPARAELVGALPGTARAPVEHGLTYPLESAGRLAQPEVVTAHPSERVEQLLARLRGEQGARDIHNLFVVDEAQRPVGVVPLHRLVRADPEQSAGEIMIAEVDTIPAATDQEEVAMLFRDHDLVSAVAVDDEGRLVGEITVDDVVDVIDEEAEEDLLRLGGVQTDDLYRAPLRTVQSRFKWLLTNLATAVLASWVISRFDAALDEIVALAILMPIVASMGGNAGTQTMTVAVRALAARELGSLNTARFVTKELMVGATNGVLFALLMGLATVLWFGSWGLALVMAAAMTVNIAVAAITGALVPSALERAGMDPAVGSTVLVTTVTDVAGFLSFLGLAAAFLL